VVAAGAIEVERVLALAATAAGGGWSAQLEGKGNWGVVNEERLSLARCVADKVLVLSASGALAIYL